MKETHGISGMAKTNIYVCLGISHTHAAALASSHTHFNQPVFLETKPSFKKHKLIKMPDVPFKTALQRMPLSTKRKPH